MKSGQGIRRCSRKEGVGRSKGEEENWKRQKKEGEGIADGKRKRERQK